MFDLFLSRNIGLISKKDQEKLTKARVLICGVGGMGGVCAEALIRMGVYSFKLIDHDIYEEINLNRQIHSNKKTIGKYKVDVLKKEFLKINPKASIKVYKDRVLENNVEDILKDVDIVVNGMDEMKSSLILERTARKKGITIVDAWITPFASVFVMDKKSPHWEEFLKLPSLGVEPKDFTDELMEKCLKIEIDYTFSHFDPYSHISKKMVKDIISKKVKRPSFLPVVWMSGILMANEVYKVVTGQKHSGFEGIFYNQYTHKIIKGKIK